MRWKLFCRRANVPRTICQYWPVFPQCVPSSRGLFEWLFVVCEQNANYKIINMTHKGSHNWDVCAHKAGHIACVFGSVEKRQCFANRSNLWWTFWPLWMYGGMIWFCAEDGNRRIGTAALCNSKTRWRLHMQSNDAFDNNYDYGSERNRRGERKQYNSKIVCLVSLNPKRVQKKNLHLFESHEF